MRPVKRPALQRTYSTYQSYLKPLLESFGPYCSYCEAAEKMDVEHVVPKSKPQGQPLEVEWSNLLLGCARCNRDFKRAVNDSRDDYLWPDSNNTFDAFLYKDTGQVKVNPSLGQRVKRAAENLKALVKLDDGATAQPVLNTRRRDRFRMAKTMKGLYTAQAMDLDGLMEIVYSAPSWSVWMTVFADIPEVRERLLNDDRFPNTAVSYFQINS